MHAPNLETPLTAAEQIELLNAAGLKLINPYAPEFADISPSDNKRLQRAYHLLGTAGLRIQQLVFDYRLNLMAEHDRGSLAEDVARLRTPNVLVGADRICARTFGAHDRQKVGLDATERELAEQALAKWFAPEWRSFIDANLSPADAAVRLMEIVTEAERRAARIPNNRVGRPQMARSHTWFIQELGVVFRKITRRRPTAIRASGDRVDGDRANGYERSSRFLDFLDAICRCFQLEELKSDTVRTALERMPDPRRKIPRNR